MCTIDENDSKFVKCCQLKICQKTTQNKMQHAKT